MSEEETPREVRKVWYYTCVSEDYPDTAVLVQLNSKRYRLSTQDMLGAMRAMDLSRPELEAIRSLGFETVQKFDEDVDFESYCEANTLFSRLSDAIVVLLKELEEAEEGA